MTELLRVEDLEVRYRTFGKPDFTAVRGVSLSVDAGEIVGLVGESGCGKSTIARSVCGLERPTAGSILFRDQPVTPLGIARRASDQLRVQMVFQDPYNSLNPRRTVGAQVSDSVALGRRWAADASAIDAGDWLERVELSRADASRFPHAFSGGQRQRIAIARALAAEPQLLIADEPISALDASLQAQIAGLMSRLVRESGAGMLFISHDLAVVRLIADRVLVMNQGVIVEQGPTEQVWNDPQDPYTQRLLLSIPLPDGLGRLPGATEATEAT
ncbi:MAG: ABC transporter ATP-binding protein [Microbacterium sp.]